MAYVKTCPTCGKTVALNAQHCPNCGHNFTIAGAQNSCLWELITVVGAIVVFIIIMVIIMK